jgi:hypothetical protein
VNEVEDEKKEDERIDAVHPASSAPDSQQRNSSTSDKDAGNPQSAPSHSQHRTTIGLHSAPFDEEEALSIMETAVPPTLTTGDGGELLEDESAMVSSDNDAVGVVPNKTAYYENIDDQHCSLM